MTIPRESIEHLVSYIIEDEAADFEQEHGEDGDPDGQHIYTHAVLVQEWLNREQQEAKNLDNLSQRRIDHLAENTGVYL